VLAGKSASSSAYACIAHWLAHGIIYQRPLMSFLFCTQLAGKNVSSTAYECIAHWLANGVIIYQRPLMSLLFCTQLADIVAARAKEGRNYGIILIPEGLIEHVPEVRVRFLMDTFCGNLN
jgi:6-phosphofructokinase